MNILISILLTIIGTFMLGYSFVLFETMDKDLPKATKILKYSLNTILLICAGLVILTAYEIMLGV